MVSLNMVKERNLDTKLLRAKRMKMSITADGKTILKNREIGLIIYSHGHRYSFGKADIVNSTSTISPIHLDADSDVRLAELGNRCNRLVIQSAAGIMLEILAETSSSFTFCSKRRMAGTNKTSSTLLWLRSHSSLLYMS